MQRMRQGLSAVGPTPAERRVDEGGPAPDLTRGLAGSLQSVAEILGPQADIAAMVDEAKRAGRSFTKGDYLDALGSMGLAAIAPLMIATPGSVKSIREVSEELMPFKKVKEGVSLKKIFNKDDKDIEQWKKDNKNPLAGERRYRDEELEKAARELNEGKISVEQFVKIRDARKPLKT